MPKRKLADQGSQDSKRPAKKSRADAALEEIDRELKINEIFTRLGHGISDPSESYINPTAAIHIALRPILESKQLKILENAIQTCLESNGFIYEYKRDPLEAFEESIMTMIRLTGNHDIVRRAVGLYENCLANFIKTNLSIEQIEELYDALFQS